MNDIFSIFNPDWWMDENNNALQMTDAVLFLIAGHPRTPTCLSMHWPPCGNTRIPIHRPPNQHRFLVLFVVLKNGKEVSDVPDYLQSLYRASVQPYLISWFKYNPRTVIASVKCRSSLFRVKMIFRFRWRMPKFLKKGCPAAELLLIDKMNHVLKDCESKAVQQQMLTYGNPSLPVNSTLIASVSTFVKKLK